MRVKRALFMLLCATAVAAAGCSGCDESTGNNTNSTTNNTTNNSTTNNTNGGTNSCTPAGDVELCEGAGAECGTISVEDNCGQTRDVECGGCDAPDSCNTDNVCECTESDEEFCARLMKDCGTVTADDACGEERSVDCGTCMDGEDCGDDNVCACPCNIDGQCVPDGMANPDNPCEVCDPATADDEWSPLVLGSACDDGLSCTTDTTCDANAECTGTLAADSCLIDGACYSDGDEDPDSSCRSCDSATNTADWTNAAQDTACDDGLACTAGEVCDGGECVFDTVNGGTCAINNTCYNQGDINPDNPCEVCNPTDDQTGWSDVSEGIACDDGLACTADTTCNGGGECTGTIMDGTCAIDEVCYNQDEANPNNSCEFCDTASSQVEWSEAADDTVCDDGLTCTENDMCNGGECEGDIVADTCLIDDECYADGDQFSGGRNCLVCDPADDDEDWTFLPVDTPCDDGLACTGDGTCNPGGACRDGDAMSGTCAINGACYADGDINPLNPCEVCDAAVENAMWSPRTGETCDDGLSCTSSDMCSDQGECVGTIDSGSCAIDRTCFTDTTVNPDNPCEVCDVATAQDEWSDVAQDTVCDDGLTCTTGTVCDGNGSCDGGTIDADTCAIDGACYSEGDSNPANDCEICTSADDQTGWSPNDGAVCTNDGDGLTCTGICNGDTCVDDLQANFCAIDNACYADTDVDPTNECQVCSVGDDTQDWTPVADETVCGPNDMFLCCAGTCLDVNACP